LNQGSEPRATAIAIRAFREPSVTAHVHFLPGQKVTPRSGPAARLRKAVATFPDPNSTPSAKSVQRFAVKRWAAVCGRPSASTACSTAGQPILAISPTKPTRSRANAEIPRPQPRRPSRLSIASPHRRVDGRCQSQVRRSSSLTCVSTTSLRGTLHQHRLTVERYGVQRRRASAVRCNALFDGGCAPLTACSESASARELSRPVRDGIDRGI